MKKVAKIEENKPEATFSLANEYMNLWACSVCKRVWMFDGCATPKDNDWNYCPFCGSVITEINECVLEEEDQYV